MKKIIAIAAGDPDSINSEIIAKAWKKKILFKNLNIFIVGNYNLIKQQLKTLKISIKLGKLKNIEKQNYKKKLLVYDVPLKFKSPFNTPIKYKSKYIIKSLNICTNLAKEKKIVGFINCPIDKKEVFKNKSFGVTEFLAKKLGVLGKETMLIYNKNLSVSPITTHIKIKTVARQISKKKIIDKLITINKFFIKKFKIQPKIGVIGLNPHNNELRKNSEENTIIIPAIKNSKKRRILVEGPISPDTAFLNYKKKGFHVLVGMYHDQVLSPFKALFKFDAINITLGLPLIRVSPDHGTGKDLIKKNMADPTSLIEAINFFKK